MNAVVLDIEETVMSRDQPLKQPGKFEYIDASRNICNCLHVSLISTDGVSIYYY